MHKMTKGSTNKGQNLCLRLWMRGPLLFFLLLMLGGPGLAQESPAQWIARIFDPTTLGIQQFPGAELNRKLSVDAIILERGGTKRIGVWIMALDQMKAAAAHFAKQFGVAAQVSGEASPFESHQFDFTTDPNSPPKLKGLKVIITHSPYVDGKGQITMEYTPPAG